MNVKKHFSGLSKLTKIIWKAFLSLVIIIPVYYFSVKINLFNLFGELPSIEQLEDPDPDLASLLLSADGKVLGKYYQSNRNPIDYDELSPYLVQALVATEDRRFYSHSGIDLIGLTRAAFNTLVLMRDRQGGSTITQQLAKMLWQTRSEQYEGLLAGIDVLNWVVIKTKEWIVATQIEKAYTKQEIISMYFNTMPFGNNTFGIKVATETYFNKNAADLQLHEAALLVGILNGPSYFNPVKHPERARRRRNWVIWQLYVNGYITENGYQKNIAKPLDLNFISQEKDDDLIAYLKYVLLKDLNEWALKNDFDLFKDGLKIYTSIDSRMQQYAEEAVKIHLSQLQKAFEVEWRDSDPWQADSSYLDRAWKSTDTYRTLLRKYGSGSDSVSFYANLPKPQQVFSWQGNENRFLSPLDSIRYYKKFLHTGFMAMNPHDGKIKAWVGGINYKYFKYDHVKQGRNQPGSTFKPFVYITAIENGYSPCHRLMDAPVTYAIPGAQPPYWTPKNATEKYSGETMTLKQALRRSMNRVTAMLMNKLGAEKWWKPPAGWALKVRLIL